MKYYESSKYQSHFEKFKSWSFCKSFVHIFIIHFPTLHFDTLAGTSDRVALITYCMTVWTFSTKSAGNMRGTCWDSEIWPPKPTVIWLLLELFLQKTFDNKRTRKPSPHPKPGHIWWILVALVSHVSYDFSAEFPCGFPMHLGNVPRIPASRPHGSHADPPAAGSPPGATPRRHRTSDLDGIWMGTREALESSLGCEVQHRVTASTTQQHRWSYVIIIYYPYWRVETTWRTPIPKSRRNGRPTPMVSSNCLTAANTISLSHNSAGMIYKASPRVATT